MNVVEYKSENTATAFGTLGYVGRASGQDFDVRRDAPYAPYDQLNLKIPQEHQGDISARVLILVVWKFVPPCTSY